MGFFGRLATLIKSNLNDLISKSEDPEKMLNQVIVDMNQQLVEAKKLGDEVMATLVDMFDRGLRQKVNGHKTVNFISSHSHDHGIQIGIKTVTSVDSFNFERCLRS